MRLPPPPPEKPATPARVWIELMALYLLTCGLIRLVRVIKDGAGLSDNWLVLVPIIFIYAPLLAEYWNGFRVDPQIQFPEPLRSELWKATRWLLLLVALIYPAFIVGNHYWQTTGLPWFTSEVLELKYPFRPHHPNHGLPDDLWLQIPYQLLCVGFAEEFFYRGYMQTRLNQLFPPDRWRLFGATFGWSLPITALLFTLGHSLVTWQWWQPFIIFPALIFGWLRSRTGNILAGTLFHAFANTAMIVLDSIYGVRPG